MTRFAVFLRAVNVAGHGTVKMADLERALSSSGYGNVKTVIQSGNVLLDAASEDAAALAEGLRGCLRNRLGLETVPIVRAVDQIEDLVRSSPFEGVKDAEGAKLYVAFLSAKPAAPPRFPLLYPKEALEAFAMKALDVFVVSRPFNGRFGFPNNFVEKELGVPATTRNWNTVVKIAGMKGS